MLNLLIWPGLLPGRLSGTRALALLFALVFSSSVYAGEDPVYTSLFSNKAAGGYDVTAYFSQHKPVEGNSKFKTTYKGATWQFASQENLDKFNADPEKYAPQYGGYCAWAAANGDTAKGDPAYWTIVNDKLYLNYDDEVQNTWIADRDNYISRADAQWPALLDK